MDHWSKNNPHQWVCQFKIKVNKDKLQLSDLKNCQIQIEKNGETLSTPVGEFKFYQHAPNAILSEASSTNIINRKDHSDHFIKMVIGVLVAAMIVIALLLRPVTEIENGEPVIEPITVNIIKDVRTVKVEQITNPQLEIKPLSPSEVSKRAVQNNLGFLGMVGSSELKNVVGGVPQQLKQATAGAGAGGDAGSGGELLTGLGKGLKKTTVGNTGVQGLGGIGTKGAGGGLGGYGNTLVASGEGKGISAIAVSSSEMILDGGISRYAINATIAKYLNQVRRCYEDELKNISDLQGTVEMSFQINALGKLNYSQISQTTLNNKTVETCISNRMMNWQFPKPKGGVNVDVKYPFMLRPVGNQ
jgi:hypothetical protein